MEEQQKLRYRFTKAERICAKKDIDTLFATSGETSFIAYPLRVVYQIQPLIEEQETSQILISVGKKYFKKANKRNRIKRLIREAYRLNKSSWIELLQSEGISCKMALMIVSKELPTYSVIEQSILKIFRKIKNREISSSLDITE